jgi:alcohol dehydrogenase (NADP+)
MTTCTGFGAPEANAELTRLTFERRAPRPDDVAIAIDYCGVCHSDMHQVHNDWNNTVYPCVPGHEIIGHVTAVGADVTAFGVGDRVAVGCLVDSCGACAACTDGQEQQCAAGMTPTYNGRDRRTGEITYGGYADHIVVRDRFVMRLPDALDPRFAGPLVCAGITVWTPLRRYNVRSESKVAVVGLGGLGHMAVKLAAALGAEVTVITTSPSKAADAQALGAHHLLLSTDPQAMRGAANAFDVIVDTIPTRHNVNPYLTLLGRDGVLVIVGAIDVLEPVHGGLLMRNTRSLVGSLIGGIAATQELLDFCAEHQVLPSCELIDISEINTAYKRMQANDVKYRFVIDMSSASRSA